MQIAYGRWDLPKDVPRQTEDIYIQPHVTSNALSAAACSEALYEQKRQDYSEKNQAVFIRSMTPLSIEIYGNDLGDPWEWFAGQPSPGR